jgi:phenylpropionate dioxygenase-like ring-hydroxylating dioxygenase large terminal subunit
MAGSYYLRNQWYVAAHGFELKDGKPIARTICDQPLVIFRGADGHVGILSDRCPHRFAPLSAGEVCGNDLQCGYHGIRFDRDGACTHIPGGLAAPSGFRAKHYPALERHGFVWIWMGEKAADPNLIPDYHENDDPGWAGVPGYLDIACNYQLMVDNLLDLTHVVFVHKTTLAGGGVTETPLEVRVEGDRVLAQRMMLNVDTAPIFRAARGLVNAAGRAGAHGGQWHHAAERNAYALFLVDNATMGARRQKGRRTLPVDDRACVQ